MKIQMKIADMVELLARRVALMSMPGAVNAFRAEQEALEDELVSTSDARRAEEIKLEIKANAEAYNSKIESDPAMIAEYQLLKEVTEHVTFEDNEVNWVLSLMRDTKKHPPVVL